MSSRSSSHAREGAPSPPSSPRFVLASPTVNSTLAASATSAKRATFLTKLYDHLDPPTPTASKPSTPRKRVFSAPAALFPSPFSAHLVPPPPPTTIRWADDGKSIIVGSTENLAKHTLRPVYGHGNMQTFVRQMCIYGFSRSRPSTDGGPGELTFRHPTFTRSTPRADILNFARKASSRSSRPVSTPSTPSSRVRKSASALSPSSPVPAAAAGSTVLSGGIRKRKQRSRAASSPVKPSSPAKPLSSSAAAECGIAEVEVRGKRRKIVGLGQRASEVAKVDEREGEADDEKDDRERVLRADRRRGLGAEERRVSSTVFKFDKPIGLPQKKKAVAIVQTSIVEEVPSAGAEGLPPSPEIMNTASLKISKLALDDLSPEDIVMDETPVATPPATEPDVAVVEEDEDVQMADSSFASLETPIGSPLREPRTPTQTVATPHPPTSSRRRRPPPLSLSQPLTLDAFVFPSGYPASTVYPARPRLMQAVRGVDSGDAEARARLLHRPSLPTLFSTALGGSSRPTSPAVSVQQLQRPPPPPSSSVIRRARSQSLHVAKASLGSVYPVRPLALSTGLSPAVSPMWSPLPTLDGPPSAPVPVKVSSFTQHPVNQLSPSAVDTSHSAAYPFHQPQYTSSAAFSQPHMPPLSPFSSTASESSLRTPIGEIESILPVILESPTMSPLMHASIPLDALGMTGLESNLLGVSLGGPAPKPSTITYSHLPPAFASRPPSPATYVALPVLATLSERCACSH